MAALIQYANGAPGIKYRIDRRIITIGRNTADNDVSLPCAFVSKHHAIIEIIENITGDGYDFYLQDLGSTNHTYVNDNAVKRIRLENGDLIRIGKAVFKFDSLIDTYLPEPLEESLDHSKPSLAANAASQFSRRLRTLGA